MIPPLEYGRAVHYDSSLKHFNRWLRQIALWLIHNKDCFDLVITMNPLLKPGCPTSWASAEINRQATSNSPILFERPFNAKNAQEFITSTAWIELW